MEKIIKGVYGYQCEVTKRLYSIFSWEFVVLWTNLNPSKGVKCAVDGVGYHSLDLLNQK